MTTNIHELIDHTQLSPTATLNEITQLCTEAKDYHFHAVCLHPYWIADAKRILQGSRVTLCTVVGFPLGASLSKAKAAEARFAVEAGAEEIDMVINQGAALEGHWNFIEHEIHEVVTAAQGKLVKVILETSHLSPELIQEACRRTVAARAHFVKTSTGFGKGGADVHVVRLMRETVGCRFGVKASGGIRTREAAEAMLEAGANRLGLSASVSIMQGTSPSATEAKPY